MSDCQQLGLAMPGHGTRFRKLPVFPTFSRELADHLADVLQPSRSDMPPSRRARGRWQSVRARSAAPPRPALLRGPNELNAPCRTAPRKRSPVSRFIVALGLNRACRLARSFPGDGRQYDHQDLPQDAGRRGHAAAVALAIGRAVADMSRFAARIPRRRPRLTVEGHSHTGIHAADAHLPSHRRSVG